jgi:transcriptional regulator with XRE-family HTH domain
VSKEANSSRRRRRAGVRVPPSGGPPASARGAGPADTTPAADVGPRLTYLRNLYGISQRELARRAGMTHGAVSLIERNESSPSVGSLRRILDSFSITLSDFFALQMEEQEKVFFSANELAQVGVGGVSLLQVGQNLKGRPLQVLLERYPPGAATAFKPYAQVGEEGGVIIQGEIEATIGGSTRTLRKFDAYLIPSRLAHRFYNSSREECLIVSACTPPV